MDQGSENWHKWRLEGVGASEVAAVLNKSPWMTRKELLEIKVNRIISNKTNWAMQRGNDLELKARGCYMLDADLEMDPYLVVHPKHEFIRASLDGYNPEVKKILEIKCPGKAVHKLALEGKLPEYYNIQIQYQLLATGAELADYYSFDGEKGVIVPVKPDYKLQEILLEEVRAFWDIVLKQRETGFDPSVFDDNDGYVEVESKELVSLCRHYKRYEKLLNDIKGKLDHVKDQIVTFSDQPKFKCAGLRVSRETRLGSIDYGRIPELKGVDLEQYRKGPITVVKITTKEKT